MKILLKSGKEVTGKCTPLTGAVVEIVFAWVVYSNAGLLHMIIQIILSVVIFALIIFMIFDPNNILSKSKLASSVSEQSLTTIKVVVSTFLILFGFLSTVFLC